MSKDTYDFTEWTEKHHGMGQYIQINKKLIWDAIKRDEEFLKLKLYKIKVEEISHQGTQLNSYVYPGYKTYITGLHWAKNLTEAKKIGEVIKQVRS
jgi:hypothetical protein